VGIVGSLALALAVLGQITATTLRGKYGPPLKSYAPGSAESFRPSKGPMADIAVNYANAETFKVRSDIEILVNYGSNGQVCRIDLPRRESGGQASADSVTQRQLREVLDELVPPSMRGKELHSLLQQLGLTSVSMTEYENLTINVISHPQTQTSITVRFKDKGCGS
jgi:hypothetical protein